MFTNILVFETMKLKFRELKVDAKGHTVSWQQMQNKKVIVMGIHILKKQQLVEWPF